MNANHANDKSMFVKGKVTDKTGELKEFNHELGSQVMLPSLIRTLQTMQQDVNVYLTQKVEEEKLLKNQKGKSEGKLTQTEKDEEEDDDEEEGNDIKKNNNTDDNESQPLEKKRKLVTNESLSKLNE